MALTQSQRSMIEKARSIGSGNQAIRLDEETCTFLAATIAADLGLLNSLGANVEYPEPFFGRVPELLRISGHSFLNLIDEIISMNPDADTYFSCLAALHKSRLKYRRILETQPMPTIDQVGPRGLLQYGSLSPHALVSLLFWRKWLFDLDNRSGQETGYLFEPIIAHAIGGYPVSATRSPVRRGGSGTGRQVDCVRGDRAYEIKLRVTIAASGQGRWRQELEFPEDCRASGFEPVLIVLDPTPNPKLNELRRAFLSQGGEAFVGSDAWNHLEDEAGGTMGQFLRKYVQAPIQALLAAVPGELPPLAVQMTMRHVQFSIGEETLVIERTGEEPLAADEAIAIPDDVDEQLPGA